MVIKLNHEMFVSMHYSIWDDRNALTILKNNFADQWRDIIQVLYNFRLLKSEIIAPGKNKSLVTQRIENAFTACGWSEKQVRSKRIIEEGVRFDKRGERIDTTETIHQYTHKVDCIKGKVALEIQWNNKDTFFSRDLEAFRMLFELRKIDIGVIITRDSELQPLFNTLGKDIGDKYGASTTHTNKFFEHFRAGGSGGCPIIVFGIKSSLYRE